MKLERNFLTLFTTLGYLKDPLLYLYREANLASFHEAIKGCKQWFLL